MWPKRPHYGSSYSRSAVCLNDNRQSEGGTLAAIDVNITTTEKIFQEGNLKIR
jgi:hypothetical protein